MSWSKTFLSGLISLLEGYFVSLVKNQIQITIHSILINPIFSFGLKLATPAIIASEIIFTFIPFVAIYLLIIQKIDEEQNSLLNDFSVWLFSLLVLLILL
ncbi:MAG: hypothetical protein ACP5N9_05560 [Candidatus Bilamarchaeum sp.]